MPYIVLSTAVGVNDVGSNGCNCSGNGSPRHQFSEHDFRIGTSNMHYVIEEKKKYGQPVYEVLVVIDGDIIISRSCFLSYAGALTFVKRFINKYQA